MDPNELKLVLVQMDKKWEIVIFEMDHGGQNWIEKPAGYTLNGAPIAIHNHQPELLWTDKVGFEFIAESPVKGTLDPEIALQIVQVYLEQSEGAPRNIVFCVNPPLQK